MSASIVWLPVKPEKYKSINAPAPSWFKETMERAGFELPCTLTSTDLPVLRGMAATNLRDDKPNPHQEVVDAVEKHGAIKIWAEY